MQTRINPRKAALALACMVAAALLASGWAPLPAPQQQQKQDKEKQKPEEKKDSGLFTGFKKVTGSEKSEEKQATASAGAKGVGEGKSIGNVPASAADRTKVARMESARPSQEEMNAFLQEGKLSKERKGGSQ